MFNLKPLRISMQYFAEDGSSGDGNTNTQQNSQQTGNQNQSNQQSGQTFSQADLNRIGAQEKDSGKKAILTAMGYNGLEDLDTAKKDFDAFKQWQESQKTDTQKAQDGLAAEQKSRQAAEKRAELAERKLALLSQGCRNDVLEDVMALALIRVNDKTDFDSAVKAVKSTHPSFFEAAQQQQNQDNGTGGSHASHRQNSTGNNSLGARLAQQKLKSTNSKNPYFKK